MSGAQPIKVRGFKYLLDVIPLLERLVFDQYVALMLIALFSPSVDGMLEIECPPHEKRGGRKGKTAGPPSKETLLIATDLLDVPVEVIALIYRYRWSIEIFFRFFKHLRGCRHLYSEHPNGVAIQVYCAIIACMLLNLWTGVKPNKTTLEIFA